MALAAAWFVVGFMASQFSISNFQFPIEKQITQRGEDPSRLAAAMTGSPDEGASARTGDATASTRPCCFSKLEINARQVSLRLTENRQTFLLLPEKVRSEQPAPHGRGGGFLTPPLASASLLPECRKGKNGNPVHGLSNPGPGKGEDTPHFARSPRRPPALADFQLPISNCPLLKERNFFAAIRTEESYDGKVLIGDEGLSKGPYHIGRAYWQDGCEQGNVDWDYNTLVYSRPHCEQIMLWYWQRHCSVALKRCDLKTLARIHNGGPTGDRKTATLEYWRQIQKHMATETRRAQR